MSWRRNALAGAIVVLLAPSAHAYDFGRTATPEEIKLWDIDVRPDGKGLPDGSGTAMHGKVVYEQNCEACHGPNGQGGIKDRLVGGQGTLASDMPNGGARRETRAPTRQKGCYVRSIFRIKAKVLYAVQEPFHKALLTGKTAHAA
jgi:Cytochrome c